MQVLHIWQDQSLRQRGVTAFDGHYNMKLMAQQCVQLKETVLCPMALRDSK